MPHKNGHHRTTRLNENIFIAIYERENEWQCFYEESLGRTKAPRTNDRDGCQSAGHQKKEHQLVFGGRVANSYSFLLLKRKTANNGRSSVSATEQWFDFFNKGPYKVEHE